MLLVLVGFVPTLCVLQALDRAMQPSESGNSHARTVLVIAHRLSTVRNAHNIVVLDKGKVRHSSTTADTQACPCVAAPRPGTRLNSGRSLTALARGGGGVSHHVAMSHMGSQQSIVGLPGSITLCILPMKHFTMTLATPPPPPLPTT